MVSTDFVQFERLHYALKLIGFESPYDKRIFHNCPQRESYVDIFTSEITQFMDREELRKYKDIFQYIHSEFRKMGLKSICVRNRVSATVDNKRKKFKTWSLHQGSSCAASFKTMGKLLCRRQKYIEENSSSKDSIDFDKLKKTMEFIKRKR